MTPQIRILVGSILMLMGTMVSAQTVQRVAMTVPFSFVARSYSLPVGDYTIELNLENETMLLRSKDRSVNNTVMLVSNSARGANLNESYATFHRYGSRYFLAEVWSQGAGQTLSPGKLEQELARKHSNLELIAVRLSPR